MMKPNCLVSVIVPIYNGEKYISDCLNSIIKQNCRDIEIICIDDGSTDATAQIVQGMATEDERIKYYYQQNQGVSSARNWGVKKATGKYTTFIDSDDALLPDAIEICVDTAEKYNSDLVIARPSRDVCSNKREKRTYNSYHSCVDGSLLIKTLLDYPQYTDSYPDEIRPLNEWHLAYSWGRLIRSDICKKHSFNTDLIYGEDVVYNYDLFYECKNIVMIDDEVYYYRPNPNSVTSSKQQPKRLKNTLLLCKEIEKRVKNNYEFRQAAYQFVMGRIMHCYASYFPCSSHSLKEQLTLISQPFICECVVNGRYLGYKKKDYVKAKVIANIIQLRKNLN